VPDDHLADLSPQSAENIAEPGYTRFRGHAPEIRALGVEEKLKLRVLGMLLIRLR
jgi:hypothetical protein